MTKKQQTSLSAETPAQATALPIALQIYTLRNLQQPPQEVLAAVAGAGFAGVELAGTFAPGMPAAELRALLDAAGLRVVSNHVALHLLEADLPGVIRAQKTLGNDTIVVPWLPEELRGKTADSWKALGARVGALAKRCQHAGMRLLYHNHDFEMAVIDGKLALDWLMEGAGTDLVGLELDVAWAKIGGQDPAAILQRYSGRCWLLHCKDAIADPSSEPATRGLADVGAGTVDWDAVLPAAKAAGVEWWVVEHDFPAEPLQSIRNSYNFLAGKLQG